MGKKLFKSLLVMVLFVFMLPVIANAKVMEIDENIDLKGEAESTKFVVSNNIKNNSFINGLAMFLGNQINAGGKVSYGGYAGNIINISGEVENDLFVAGNVVTLEKQAVVNRDVFIAGSTVNIDTNIKRNINIAAATVNLSDIVIEGSANIYAENITFNENTVIKGTLTVYETSNIKGLNKDNVGKYVEKEENLESESLVDRIKDIITNIISRFVVALIIFLVFAKLAKSLDKVELNGKEIGSNLLSGFVVLIAVPVVSIIALCTGILLPLSLMLIATYIAAIYLTATFVAKIAGHYIWGLFNQKENIVPELLIGVVLLEILSLIPIINFLVGAATLFYGLGLMYHLLKKYITSKK